MPVTLAVGAINVGWLLPVAVCVTSFGVDGGLGLIVAYLPLVILAIKFHAGEIEKTRPSIADL
ncbi:hypothetical protein D3C73_1271330 [compost metagenome]